MLPEGQGTVFKYSLICVHAPTEEKSDDEKDVCYDELENAYSKCPRRDCKIIIGDKKEETWVGKEEIFKPVIGKFSLHDVSNDSGINTKEGVRQEDCLACLLCNNALEKVIRD